MLGRTSSTPQQIETKQLARGKLGDRPWGLTLGVLGLRGHSGQLTVTTADRKAFHLVLSGGFVIEAVSPVSADSIGRVALTQKLIPAAHAAEIAKRAQRSPERDEVKIVAEVAKISREEIDQLRRRAILQRAARTFSIEGGTYRLERQVTIPTGTPSEIDIRAIVYAGAQQHLSEQRMFEDLRVLGARFVLNDEARPMLARFGFGDADAEAALLAALVQGTTLAEIEAAHREIDPRTARAMIYALACCDAITRVDAAQRPAIAKPRTSTETFAEQQTTTIAARSLSQREIETLIADRCSLIDAGRDLFAVLGLESGASIDAVRSAYLELVRYIHPDKLAMFGIADTPDSQRLYSQASVAYSTLSDPEHRGRYIAQAEKPAEQDRTGLAHEAYVRGVRLLEANRPDAAVAELSRACELAPFDVDYSATLAWATFCAAPHKPQVETVTRRVLERAIHRSQHPEHARSYLGKVERMLGHDLEALQHFREILEVEPDNADAAAEIRVIEARLAKGTKPFKRK